MTPEERAKKLMAGIDGFAFPPSVEDVAEAIRAALAEEREAIIALAAEAYCFRCAGGERVIAEIRARP